MKKQTKKYFPFNLIKYNTHISKDMISFQKLPHQNQMNQEASRDKTKLSLESMNKSSLDTLSKSCLMISNINK